MIKTETKKAKAAIKAMGSKDNSHIARYKKGWRKGSACFFVQCRLGQPVETIAKAIRKTEFKNQACYSTLPKAIARIETLVKQAKGLKVKKAHV